MDANAKKTALRMIPYGIYVLEMQHGEEETRMRMVKRI